MLAACIQWVLWGWIFHMNCCLQMLVEVIAFFTLLTETRLKNMQYGFVIDFHFTHDPRFIFSEWIKCVCCCCCCLECVCRNCVQNMAYCFLYCSYFVYLPQQEEITGCWLRTIVKPCMDITSCSWPVGEYMVHPLLCIISKVMWLPYLAESEDCHCHPDTWQCSLCLKR